MLQCKSGSKHTIFVSVRLKFHLGVQDKGENMSVLSGLRYEYL